MKEKKEAKLRLNKATVQDWGPPLSMDEQKAVKGGDDEPKSLTIVPVYC